jgi:hypothetical protein
MGFFSSSDELRRCIGALCEVARCDERVGKSISAARLVVRFTYDDPSAVLTINGAQPSAESGCYFDASWEPDSPLVPEVELLMQADVAHRFWHGRVNLLGALTSGEIVARGSIAKILRVLPAIQPLYTIYPRILRDLGRDDLVIS